MAFRLPTFNITVNIWRQAMPPPAPPAVITPGQLRHAEHITSGLEIPGGVNSAPMMALLLPLRTDIRDGWPFFVNDLVEAPAGTGRFYAVFYVDDVARDFPNEYRLAYLVKRAGWPVPIP